MATTTSTAAPAPAVLRLEPLDERGAAELGTPTIEGDGPVFIGRARGSDVCLSDPSVSRRHARLLKREGRWFVEDLGGRHGTYVNGVRLEAGQPSLAVHGDFIRVGPYTFRLSTGGGRATTLAKTDQDAGGATIVERVSNKEMGALAQRRLDVLIDGAVAIHQADDEERLGDAIVRVAMAGTGFPRAALIRPIGAADEVEVLAWRDIKSAREEFTFSRSLLREAAAGHIARLQRHDQANLGQSIEKLGITGALCAPIVLDASVVGFLYLDSRDGEQAGYGDAPGFCHAVAKLAGLALSNIKRGELQRRQDRLEEELEGARTAQRFLCPTGEGEIGPLRYAMITEPGQFVAGDLFDIFAIDEHRVGICFGDVSGHGVSAALHMTAVLAQMRAVLARYVEPGIATREVNRYIAERSPADMFVSLWVGVYDDEKRELRYVDAGHGHWMIKRAGAAPEPAVRPGGLLVGIDEDYPYEAVTLGLGDEDRIVIYSDGVVEQTNGDGEPFEKARALEVLAASNSASEDVAKLFEAVKSFARTYLADDTTIASIELARR